MSGKFESITNLRDSSLIGIKWKLKRYDKNFPSTSPHKFVMFSDGSCGIVNNNRESIEDDELKEGGLEDAE